MANKRRLRDFLCFLYLFYKSFTHRNNPAMISAVIVPTCQNNTHKNILNQKGC